MEQQIWLHKANFLFDTENGKSQLKWKPVLENLCLLNGVHHHQEICVIKHSKTCKCKLLWHPELLSKLANCCQIAMSCVILLLLPVNSWCVRYQHPIPPFIWIFRTIPFKTIFQTINCLSIFFRRPPAWGDQSPASTAAPSLRSPPWQFFTLLPNLCIFTHKSVKMTQANCLIFAIDVELDLYNWDLLQFNLVLMLWVFTLVGEKLHLLVKNYTLKCKITFTFCVYFHLSIIKSGVK